MVCYVENCWIYSARWRRPVGNQDIDNQTIVWWIIDTGPFDSIHQQYPIPPEI